MKCSPLLACAVLLCGPAAAAASARAAAVAESKVTPVQKVIELMVGMMEKGKSEKNKEEVQFAKYKQFCEDTTVEKQRDIKEAKRKIEILKADILEYIAVAKKLTKEIAEHDEDIDVWTGDKEAASKVRKFEKRDYEALHKDYSESLSALEHAIAVLKDQNRNRKQASFAQVSAVAKLSLVPPEAKRAIDLFMMQDEPEALSVTAPEANAYEFQSKGVIDMLEKLEDKFAEERTKLEKDEIEAQNAFEMLMADLKAQIEEAKADRDEKAKIKAKKLQAKADAEGDLEDTSTTLAADEKYLANLVATCEQKATDFESRQELRGEELEAIQKAIDILESDAVSGNAEKHLPSLLQKKRQSLGQLRAGAAGPAQQRAAEYLQEQAVQLRSRVLSALASRVADDPFKKVKKMINDLLVRLMEEAHEEAEHKGWCDTELSTNEQTRKAKTMKVETLHAEIDQLEASITNLGDDIAALTDAVAELDGAMAKATKIRAEEREENEATIKDAKEAQQAVARALTVLEDFYAKAGEATAFVQQDPEAPEIFGDSPYKGMGAENGGVVGMLEVIESDFARLEAETSAEEAAAQKEYDEFMTESKIDKMQKIKDNEYKSDKKQKDEQALTKKKADLSGTQKELDAAMDYYDKLKPSCVDAGVSYEDRVARRKDEIESLQEALRILNGEDLA